MKRLPAGALILLDTAAFIYLFDPQSLRNKVANDVFGRIEAGDLRGLMSTLVYTEVLMPAFRPGSTTTPAIVLSLVQSLRNIARSAAADATCIEAARLRATHNLRTPDAIHAATAPIGKADGMLTNDRRLTRLEREGLKVWQIDDLV